MMIHFSRPAPARAALLSGGRHAGTLAVSGRGDCGGGDRHLGAESHRRVFPAGAVGAGGGRLLHSVLFFVTYLAHPAAGRGLCLVVGGGHRPGDGVWLAVLPASAGRANAVRAGADCRRDCVDTAAWRPLIQAIDLAKTIDWLFGRGWPTLSTRTQARFVLIASPKEKPSC